MLPLSFFADGQNSFLSKIGKKAKLEYECQFQKKNKSNDSIFFLQ